MSERMSATAIVGIKPSWVDKAVRAMYLTQKSKPSLGKALPSRLAMFCRAQYSTP
jgi:hypothetical protein